ncbi:MAG: Ig-like domain-containing protein, partial [Candidatus Riflebacteria bacterium]|nr:Ig-like domain-containing protein [Candidatus Riflebacteria bacterium]
GTSVTLTETGAATGIYRGSYQCSGLSDGAFTVTSDITPSVSKTLILTTPTITGVLPADNSSNVSNAQVIKITFSEPLSASTVIASNIRLIKKANSENVAATLFYTAGSNEVTLRPDSVLNFSTEYKIIVENITDAAGNAAADSSFSFTTQNSATPPSTVTSLTVYTDTSYSSLLASGSVLAPGSDIAISVEAVDASTTTLDYINVCLKDYTNNQSRTISLPETGVNTGVFRGTAELYEIENSYIVVYALTDESKAVGLKTDFYPAYTDFAPASGSTGLYLDNQIEITTNNNIDAATLSKSSVILESSSGTINYGLSKPADKKIVVSITSAEPNDNLTLTLSSALKDSSGLSFPLSVLTYKLRDRGVNSFKAFNDAVFSSEITNGSDVEANQQIYCEINGVDLTQIGVTDSMEISYTDGDITETAVLTEYAAGKYRGSLIVPNSFGKTLKIEPTGFSNKALNLNILEPFVLKEYYPASASIGIPADAWPTWTFSRPIPESELVSSKFSVYNVAANSRINGTLSLSPSGKQVRFKPDSVFDILTLYEMRLSSEVKDTYGNKLGTSLKTRFTTQPPPLPPTNLASFANYSDENYNATASAVLSNSNLYLQMVAEDPSFSTYEAASVRLDSDDGTYDGVVLTLIETNPPSGIFRIVYPVNLPAGTKITLTPQVDDSFAFVVTVRDKPRLLSLSPASASVNLYLDSKFEMNFSSELDREAFEAGVTIKNSNGEKISYACEYSNNGKKAILTPENLLQANQNYLISAKSIKNAEGQSIDDFTYKLSTKKENLAELELYTGLAPCDGKKVSETKEIVRGLLGIVASTTDMLKYSEESRIVRLSDASHSVDISI